MTPDGMARTIGVDPKTVERWIAGRVPHRRHQLALAAELHEDVRYLWQDEASTARHASGADVELVAFYPHRSLVPSETWIDFFRSAQREIGVLVHAGGFLAENARFLRLLRERAEAGTRVRMLLGDPDSPEIERRGAEERLGEGVAYKVRNALACYRHLFAVQGIEFRLHRSTLLNSLYRADDAWLVNTQAYGVSANQTPVLHLRRTAGADLVNLYERSFEQVWDEAAPVADRRATS
jgi:hypothetical protein